ncbi:MAG: hypothetical protein BWY77_00207 [bacterium ADurb.Bin431]|nr:MAG: hypothetical protein BWY77_00207 [bacterium ADurb.Bin431]HOH08808.1 hypothetical protein [bacterium]HOY45679.1 hypothetical protein [bacterium]HPG81649.1 hypothetical protein [bacterium]HPM57960.1 hypothetical protein [bacterium]
MKSAQMQFGIKALIILLLILIAAPPLQEANAEPAGVCEKGLAVCMVSSFLEAGIPALWAMYAAFCLNGYAWCKAYADPYF